MKNKIILLISAILISIIGKAQEVNAEPEMADTFRSEGKIYVVISVLVIAFSCIIGYLVYIDMKLKRLENKK
jgi:Na+/alanine symporter